MTESVPTGSAGGALVIVGRVRKPQGIHGELLVESLTDAPDAVFAAGRRVLIGTVDGDPDPDGATLTLRRARPFKGGFIVGFEELSDRAAAETWRGRYLLLPQDELPELRPDEVYQHDLLGMRVHDDAAGELGTVSAVFDLPSGLTLEVSGANGSVLLPYRPEIIRVVDVGERVVRIAAPPGLFG